MAEDQTNQTACREFELHLAAYLEGEAVPAVSAHARACPFCHVILADLEAIRQAGRELRLEEPPARVWANIRAQLAQEGIIREAESAWPRWFPALLLKPVPLAALAAVAVFGVFLMVRSRNFGPGSAPSVASNRPVATAGATAPVDPSEASLARTIKEMEANYQEREKALDPAVKVVYQKSLKSLDTSIDECRDSVRQEPANDLAHEYLIAAYTQKAEVLASALQFEGR